MTDLFVTNYNRNFTGVSSTAANVIRQQIDRYNMALVGHPLPGCPTPITQKEAYRLSHSPQKPVAIWHVRRNPEMRAAIWLRDIRRAPIRIVFTSAAQRLHSAYPRWLISRMDAVIATTDKAAEFVPNVHAIVPHGVDTTRFTPAPDRAAAWAALGYGGTHGIATVGRIRPEKGTDAFVEAMLHHLPKDPGAVALVIGRAGGKHDGFLKTLQAKTQTAGLADRLLFPGEVAPDKLPALMQALSLIVQLPTYEGYGMAPLEGLSSAVPFVASDTGYYRQFSAQGEVGTIVDRTPQAVSTAISDQLDRLSHTASKARQIAEIHFSAQREADGIADVYDALWGNPRP